MKQKKSLIVSLDVSVKWIGGMDPVAVFFDSDDKEVEKVHIGKFSEEEIHRLLTSKVQILNNFLIFRVLNKNQLKSMTVLPKLNYKPSLHIFRKEKILPC